MLHHIFELYILSRKIKSMEDDPSKLKEYNRLIFMRFGSLSSINKMARGITYSRRRFEIQSSTAEDTVLKLNEGGINQTEKLFDSFSRAQEVHQLCNKIILD